ncbi:ribosome biogenesis factor YjgA [uncultured Thalassolituus sp.]|uniref:ribosome biogenesis factor YjgA n=1 Tax=uncultured Thalassolituus sp. TaxID=285273 RepID=UPI002634EE01|nr:ribosome biogenesis factor YjgA [uncultured Thalassolituus sp.]
MSSYEDDEDFISKSELKREMHRFQELGEKLAALSPEKWATMPMTETLKNALQESRRVTKHEARRRHFQYIGKVMRHEDVDALQEALDLLDPSSELYGRRIRQLEQWRTRLVEDSNALNDFIDEHPAVDRQQLRNLVRNAQKEMQQEPPKPGSGYKKLFQFLKEEIAAAS